MARAGTVGAHIAVLLHEAKTRPGAAAELMALAAEYLSNGQTVPKALAAYLADALAMAAQADAPDSGNILARELMLSQSANAPIKGRRFDVALLIAKHDAKVQSLPSPPMEKQLVSDVMETLGVSQRTAAQRISEVRAAMKDAPALSSN